jgi:hypothetical protein
VDGCGGAGLEMSGVLEVDWDGGGGHCWFGSLVDGFFE